MLIGVDGDKHCVIGFTLCSSSVTLIMLIMLRFITLICCANISSHVLINTVWKSFSLSLRLSFIVVVIVILFSFIIVSIVVLLSFFRSSSSSFQDEDVSW